MGQSDVTKKFAWGYGGKVNALNSRLRRRKGKQNAETEVNEELALKPQIVQHACDADTLLEDGTRIYPTGTCVFAQVADAECGRYCLYGDDEK